METRRKIYNLLSRVEKKADPKNITALKAEVTINPFLLALLPSPLRTCVYVCVCEANFEFYIYYI